MTPSTTARYFRDGWFITNDVGVIPAPGKLRLLGRRDDMIIIAGVKQLPFPLEEALRGIPGVREAIVLAADDATLAALVELAAGQALDPLLPAITKVLSGPAWQTAVRAIEVIPRTPANKSDRRAAAALFAHLPAPTSALRPTVSPA